MGPVAPALAFLAALLLLPGAGRALPPGAVPVAGSSDTLRLTLDSLVERALAAHPALLSTRARAAAAEAREGAAGAFRFPGIGVSVSAVRSDDPVAAFGTRLRQGRFTESDFALAALNEPDAIPDWSGEVGVSWRGLDLAAWRTLDAARAEARSVALDVERSVEATVMRTRVLHASALRARGRLDATRTSLRAAEANRALLARRRDEGLATDAPVLRAEAAVATARAEVVSAEREVEDLRDHLALHLGLPEGTTIVVSGSLPDLAAREALAPIADPARRADVRAVAAVADAARHARRSAEAGRLPALELFAAGSAHAPDPFDRYGRHGTVGARLTAPLFTGGALGAHREEARAVERAARIEHAAAERRARVEAEVELRMLRSARLALDAVRAGRTAAEEAARLTRRRVEEGLALPAELLAAEAEAARLRAEVVDARAAVVVAVARVDFARGTGVSDGGTPRERAPRERER